MKRIISAKKLLSVKHVLQILFCAGVASSSIIIYYWPDLLMIPLAVPFVGFLIFSLLVVFMPHLFWNIVVVLFFWGILYGFVIVDKIVYYQDWSEICRYITKPGNFFPAILTTGIHVLIQTSFFLFIHKFLEKRENETQGK